MKRIEILAAAPLALILAASLLAAVPAEAQQIRLFELDDDYFDPFHRRASGVYLVTGFPAAGPPFLLIFDVYREGMFSASAQVQGTTLSETAFIDDQGIWKKTGDREITARLLSFNFLPPGAAPPHGAPHSNAIADVVMDVSEDFTTVSGTFSITVYPLDVNPLDPAAQPLGPPNVILFEGQRLTLPDD